MYNYECEHCGEEFETEVYLQDACPDCQQAIDNIGDIGDNDLDLFWALCNEYNAYPKDVRYMANNIWEVDGDDYKVLDEYDATKKAYEHMEELLWAFSSIFLAEQTGLPVKVFTSLDSECDNEAVKALIEITCGLEELYDEAISQDGLMHFLEDYANELYVNGSYYYSFPQ